MFCLRLQLMMTALIAFCCVSCTDTDESGQSQDDRTRGDTVLTDDAPPPIDNRSRDVVLQVVDELPASRPPVSFDITSTKVVGDSLQVTGTSGGGCEDHVFTAYWAPVWLEESPESTEILIVHDDKEDRCEAVVVSVLTIDLTPIKKMAKGDRPENELSEVTLTLVVNGQRVAHVPYRF